MKAPRLSALVILALLAGALAWKSKPARTAPVVGTDPIALLIPSEIGGMTQWLLIRGTDRGAPILLWLHGGPGSAQMPIHGLTADLERDFVVVHAARRWRSTGWNAPRRSPILREWTRIPSAIMTFMCG